MHSTRTRNTTEQVKVAADFFGLALADVILSAGPSSFSGNAASVGNTPHSKVGRRHVCGKFAAHELDGLNATLRGPGQGGWVHRKGTAAPAGPRAGKTKRPGGVRAANSQLVQRRG